MELFRCLLRRVIVWTLRTGVPVCSMSTKPCYLFLLSERLTDPHCVEKFAPAFDVLYCPSTWRSLSYFDLDRQVIDLNWKIAHGVLYTAERLSSFGLSIPPSVFLWCSCGDFVSLVFCLPFGSKCPVVAAVADVFF